MISFARCANTVQQILNQLHKYRSQHQRLIRWCCFMKDAYFLYCLALQKKVLSGILHAVAA